MSTVYLLLQSGTKILFNIADNPKCDYNLILLASFANQKSYTTTILILWSLSKKGV